jgi:hypothetical protein
VRRRHQSYADARNDQVFPDAGRLTKPAMIAKSGDALLTEASAPFHNRLERHVVLGRDLFRRQAGRRGEYDSSAAMELFRCPRSFSKFG